MFFKNILVSFYFCFFFAHYPMCYLIKIKLAIKGASHEKIDLAAILLQNHINM